MSVARNRQIQRILAVDHIALHVELFGGDHAHTGSQHQAGGGLRGGARLAAGLAHVLVQQVFKNRAVALKARGVHVGQVIGNHIHARLLRVEARFGHPH